MDGLRTDGHFRPKAQVNTISGTITSTHKTNKISYLHGKKNMYFLNKQMSPIKKGHVDRISQKWERQTVKNYWEEENKNRSAGKLKVHTLNVREPSLPL